MTHDVQSQRNSTDSTIRASRRRFMACAATLVGSQAAVHPSWADRYPSRPIKLLVGFPAGGGLDLVARRLQPALSQAIGQPVVIENRPGASGILAASAAARAAPDGYTLVLTVPGSMSAARLVLGDKLQYDPQKDLLPVGRVGYTPLVVVVNADSPLRSMTDLDQLARDKPEGLDVASTPQGSPAHFAIEIYKARQGIPLTPIAFSGASQGLTALLGGQVPALVTTLTAALALLNAKRIRALAVSGTATHQHLPGVPLLTAKGEPVDIVGWAALHAPQGTPAPVIAQLNQALNQVLALDSLKESLANELVLTPGSPEDLARYVSDETRRLTEISTQDGLQKQ